MCIVAACSSSPVKTIHNQAQTATEESLRIRACSDVRLAMDDQPGLKGIPGGATAIVKDPRADILAAVSNARRSDDESLALAIESVGTFLEEEYHGTYPSSDASVVASLDLVNATCTPLGIDISGGDLVPSG